MEKMIGAIYAIPSTLVNRLFDGRSKVFVKVTGHGSTKLLPKHKVVFYASHGEKKLVGEGIVEKIEFLTPEETLARYRKELFINVQEFQDYVHKRQTVLTLKLKGLKKYPQPVQSKEVITMGGKYITAEYYNSLFPRKQ
jgi:hypothetical protein